MFDLVADWRDMQRRILDQLENDKLPDFAEAIMEVSPEIYTDSQRFSLECNEVFRRQPLLAGLSSDVSAAGDYLEMDVAGAPVLVIRGSDGELRDFLNVCAHRGARPLNEAVVGNGFVPTTVGYMRMMAPCIQHPWQKHLQIWIAKPKA